LYLINNEVLINIVMKKISFMTNIGLIAANLVNKNKENPII